VFLYGAFFFENGRSFIQVKIKTMTTTEIAEKLVDYVRKGQYESAQKELYAEHAVS
jgi:hypothetical protein